MKNAAIPERPRTHRGQRPISRTLSFTIRTSVETILSDATTTHERDGDEQE